MTAPGQKQNGTLLKREQVAEYRDAKILRGECRECKKPAMRKKNGELARVCKDHADADAKRKAKKAG